MTVVHSLNGKKVFTKDLVDIGEISGAVMDDEWTITHLHLALNSQTARKLGHIKPILGHVTLCLPVHIIENKNEPIRLNKTIEEVKVLPECKTH